MAEITPSIHSIPTAVWEDLNARFPDLMLLGAHARDHVLHTRARLPIPRATTDLDIAIGVDSPSTYRTRTRELTKLGDTGTSFLIAHHRVDIIPFGGLTPGEHGYLELEPGVFTDVTGLQEAYENAEILALDGFEVRTPTLEALVVLKTIAWMMRGPTTDKDATDLVELLKATAEGDYEPRIWTATASGLLDRFLPDEIGAYLTGKEVAAIFGTSAQERCLDAWDGQHTPKLVAAGDEWSQSFEERLKALASGVREHV